MANDTRIRNGSVDMRGVGLVSYQVRDHFRADGTVYLSMLVGARKVGGNPLSESELEELRTQLGVQ